MQQFFAKKIGELKEQEKISPSDEVKSPKAHFRGETRKLSKKRGGVAGSPRRALFTKMTKSQPESELRALY